MIDEQFFKHGYPTGQWTELKEKRVPLSVPVHSDEWAEASRGRYPDLTLAHYLAARFVAFSLAIPQRIKDCVVDTAPETVRMDLNAWNKDVSRYSYPFNDIRIRTPMMAIAESVAGAYLPRNRKEEIEKLALIIFDMSVSFVLTRETEALCSK